MKQLSFREAFQVIYKNEGIKGFSRGLTAGLVKNSFSAGQYFSMLFYTELLLRKMNLFSDPTIHFSAGAITRAFMSVASNPIIVIKTRLEVVGFNEY